MAKTYKYKLTKGKHTDRQGPYGPLDLNGNPRRTLRTFKAGDVFESNTNLAEVFNTSNSVKFEPLEDNHPVPKANLLPNDTPQTKPSAAPALSPAPAPTPPPAAEVDDTLDTMTVAELKKFAAEEDIDLAGATTKADILATIRASV